MLWARVVGHAGCNAILYEIAINIFCHVSKYGEAVSQENRSIRILEQPHPIRERWLKCNGRYKPFIS